jgi:hypothetical protein
VTRVGRPPAPEGSLTAYVRLPESQHRRIADLAAYHGVSMSTMLRAIVRRALARGIEITDSKGLAERGPASNGLSSRSGAPWD